LEQLLNGVEGDLLLRRFDAAKAKAKKKNGNFMQLFG